MAPEITMSDEKALLAAIWEHPHEDTPRLVYADWLEENDQPERAEFIRVQCEIAGLTWLEQQRRPELYQREECSATPGYTHAPSPRAIKQGSARNLKVLDSV